MKRILVVDDEAFVRQAVAEFLTRHGYDVTAAESGSRALELLSEFQPDLVLLDVFMPEMDGLEVLRRIRQRPERPGVLMVTAAVDTAIARKAIQYGAWDYITKPFKFDQLVSMVSIYFLMYRED